VGLIRFREVASATKAHGVEGCLGDELEQRKGRLHDSLGFGSV
jgi:hypothetical protein